MRSCNIRSKVQISCNISRLVRSMTIILSPLYRATKEEPFWYPEHMVWMLEKDSRRIWSAVFGQRSHFFTEISRSKKSLILTFSSNFGRKFFSNVSKKFSRPPMHFIFSSESVFNLPVCPPKNLGWYNKTVKKFSKKHYPPNPGFGGG